MNNLKYAALAAFIGAFATPAMADKAETKGGLVVKTDDGRFEFKLGGRIHWDGNFYTDDDDMTADSVSDTFIRRARLSLEGKAYGWSFKLEEDFADDNFKELWVGTSVFGQNLRIGQAKPYRGMEELTSSNEIVFMERPFATASGIYQQFRSGLFLDGNSGDFGYGVSVYNQKALDGATAGTNEAIGFNARGYFAAVNTDTTTFHIGVSASQDGNYGPPADLRPRPRLLGRAGAGGTRPSFAGSATNIQNQTTYALELAGKTGPFYAQAEYAQVGYEFDDGTADEDVTTYYVQASYLITGEVKPYDVKKGVFKSPKPNGPSGAWEAKARYDVIENDDTDAEGSQWILGLNYYVNPNVRFMLEYVDGTYDPGVELTGSLIQTRAQFNF